MKRLLISSFLLVAIAMSATSFSSGHQDENKPALVILPPVIRTQQNAERSDKQVNPNELMPRVLPRMEREVNKKKWPFVVSNPKDIEAIYLKAANSFLLTSKPANMRSATTAVSTRPAAASPDIPAWPSTPCESATTPFMRSAERSPGRQRDSRSKW